MQLKQCFEKKPQPQNLFGQKRLRRNDLSTHIKRQRNPNKQTERNKGNSKKLKGNK